MDAAEADYEEDAAEEAEGDGGEYCEQRARHHGAEEEGHGEVAETLLFGVFWGYEFAMPGLGCGGGLGRGLLNGGEVFGVDGASFCVDGSLRN